MKALLVRDVCFIKNISKVAIYYFLHDFPSITKEVIQ